MSVKSKNPKSSSDVEPASRPKSLYRMEAFVVTSLEVLHAVADGKLYGNTLRVFAYLLTQCKRSNRYEGTQALIGAALDMKAPNVSRAIAELVELGYLIRITDAGRRYLYVDARRVFRGSAERHEAALDKQRRQRERERRANVVALGSRAPV